MKGEKNGTFVISLDFELLWGVHDGKTKESFRENIVGARKAVEEMLELFDRYQIHATWGVVGMLMAQSREEILQYSPELRPQYENPKLSAYQYINQVGDCEDNDISHLAYSLIAKINTHRNQELASHTFSHYYCKAPGQNVEAFSADLAAAQAIARAKFGRELKSLILPRNHFVKDYLDAAYEQGFSVIRGNPPMYAYNTGTKIAKALRLLDTYFCVCGRKSYTLKDQANKKIINIQASSFFRKYNTSLSFLEKQKVAYIKREMTYAAKKGQIYHLWWHPHNVALHREQCMAQLEEIFQHYVYLKEKYGFESKTMYETSEENR